jgi:branched-subunit amino acid ABC-type transport system permease component
MGGILIGIVENYGGFLLSAGYKDAIAFVLLIIFLLINPTGLSGLFNKKDRVKIMVSKDIGEGRIQK